MTEVVVIAESSLLPPMFPDVEVLAGAWAISRCRARRHRRSLARSPRCLDAILPDRSSFPVGHFVSCSVCEMAVSSRQSGDPCPRCGGTLDRNVTRRFAPALAAVAAAIPLSLPAYTSAIMVNDQLTGVLEHTVMGTVQLMADRGYWQMGVIVLVTGVVIPFVEIVGMIWLLARTRFPSPRGLIVRTRLYRVLHRLGVSDILLHAAIAAPSRLPGSTTSGRLRGYSPVHARRPDQLAIRCSRPA